MKRTLLTSFLAVTALATPALADDFVGTIEVDGKVADVSGNQTKFKEYRDIGSGVTGKFLLDWSNDKSYYLNFTGENFGYNADDNKIQKDSEFMFKVGQRDEFKYSLFYKETPHNLTLGARSPYTGVGSTALVTSLANNATISAASLTQYYNKPKFDYTIDRQDYGAEMELSFNTPFFVNARFVHNETSGLLPIGTYLSGQKELPAPISYSSDNLYLTTGYRSNNLIVTLDGTISDFTNANSSFTYAYSSGAPAATARTYLAPDSMHYKLGGNVMYRLPLWSTTFMARASHSISDNTISLSEEANTHSINNFKGKITYTTASAAITTTPLKPLDVKLYLNYLDKQNESSNPFLYYTGAPTAAQIAGYGTTEKFDYNKLNLGFDVSYKLPAKTKLATGYEYLRIKRTMIAPDPANTNSWGVRNDAPKTEDHIVYLQAKNELLDWLTAKVRYQRLFRTSDFRGDLFAALTDNRQIKAFWRPADTADKTQDMVKVGLDFEATSDLTVGMEYSLKYNNYTESVLGMQRDTRNEFYMDANYRVAMVKLNPYAELEIVDNNSKHRRYQTAGAASPYSVVNDNTNYNWTSSRKDVNFALGLNSDIDIIKDKLTFSTGYRFEKANGKEDFTSTFATTTPLVNNEYVDDYTKNTLTANLKYNITKNLNVGLGYLFESLRFTDTHYNNYSYLTSATTGTGTLLTGAYNNPDYDAHVAFLTVGYKF